MSRLSAALDSLILLLLGGGLGYLVLGGRYWRVMNPKFIWLTGGGAVFVLLFSAAVLLRPSGGIKVFRWIIYLVFMVAVVAGDPLGLWSEDDFDLSAPIAVEEKDKIEKMDGHEYLIVNPATLYLATWESFDIEQRYVVHGMVKRHPDLDAEGQFAFIGTYIWCCLADAAALGFRVPYADLEQMPDEQWLKIYGTLAQAPEKMPLPAIRAGAVAMTILSDEYLLIPEKVVKVDPPVVKFEYD